MAENNPYKLSIPAADVDKGVIAGYNAYGTPGIPYGDGRGGFRTASPGVDYGFPTLTGNGPPTPAVAANLGQHYFDMAATAPPYEYICVGYTAYGFTWRIYGDSGSGFRTLGRFETLAELRDAVDAGMVPAPTAGDAYFIGATPPYDVVVWDRLAAGWDNIGPLGGSGGGGSSGTAVGIPPHGSEGQVLVKSSAADYDVVWGEAVPSGSVGTDKIANAAVTAAKLADGSVSTAKLASSSVTAAKLADDAKPVVKENAVLSGTNWQGSDIYASAGFPYRASIAISGVTSRHLPIVSFSPEDALSGKYAPVAETYEGGVYIYASEALTGGAVIPSIVCIPT